MTILQQTAMVLALTTSMSLASERPPGSGLPRPDEAGVVSPPARSGDTQPDLAADGAASAHPGRTARKIGYPDAGVEEIKFVVVGYEVKPAKPGARTGLWSEMFPVDLLCEIRLPEGCKALDWIDGEGILITDCRNQKFKGNLGYPCKYGLDGLSDVQRPRISIKGMPAPGPLRISGSMTLTLIRELEYQYIAFSTKPGTRLNGTGLAGKVTEPDYDMALSRKYDPGDLLTLEFTEFHEREEMKIFTSNWEDAEELRWLIEPDEKTKKVNVFLMSKLPAVMGLEIKRATVTRPVKVDLNTGMDFTAIPDIADQQGCGIRFSKCHFGIDLRYMRMPHDRSPELDFKFTVPEACGWPRKQDEGRMEKQMIRVACSGTMTSANGVKTPIDLTLDEKSCKDWEGAEAHLSLTTKGVVAGPLVIDAVATLTLLPLVDEIKGLAIPVGRGGAFKAGDLDIRVLDTVTGEGDAKREVKSDRKRQLVLGYRADKPVEILRFTDPDGKPLEYVASQLETRSNGKGKPCDIIARYDFDQALPEQISADLQITIPAKTITVPIQTKIQVPALDW